MKRFLVYGLLAWLAAFVACLPANAAVTIETFGHNEQTAGPGNVHYNPVTTSAGDTIILFCASYIGTGDAFATNQSAGTNTLTPLTTTPVTNASVGGSTTIAMGVWACQNCNALSGEVITCQTTNPTGGTNYMSMAFFALKNVPASSIDLNNYQTLAASTSPSYSASGNTAQANELVFGAISTPGGSGTHAAPGGWTNQTDVFNTAGVVALAIDTKLLTSVQTPTYNPSIQNSSTSNEMIISVKDVTAGGGGGVAAHNGMFLNIGP